MFKDIFGREVKVGDFIYFTQINHFFSVNASNFGIVIGDNCVKSGLTFYIHAKEYAEKLFYKNCILLTKLSDEELNIKKAISSYTVGTVPVSRQDYGRKPMFLSLTHMNVVAKGCDILGKKISPGDLVLLRNTCVQNDELDKIHLGICVGEGRYAVFDKDAKVKELETHYGVYRLDEDCEEVKKVKAVFCRQHTIMMQESILRENKEKELRKRELKIGEILEDIDGYNWIYLGKYRVIFTGYAECDMSGYTYVKLDNECLEYYDVKKEVLKVLNEAFGHLRCMSRRSQKLLGYEERKELKLINYEDEMCFNIVGNQVQLIKL